MRQSNRCMKYVSRRATVTRDRQLETEVGGGVPPDGSLGTRRRDGGVARP
jgi:hypothetical protein